MVHHRAREVVSNSVRGEAGQHSVQRCFLKLGRSSRSQRGARRRRHSPSRTRSANLKLDLKPDSTDSKMGKGGAPKGASKVQQPRRLAVIRRQAEATCGGDKVAFKMGEGSEALGGRGWLILSTLFFFHEALSAGRGKRRSRELDERNALVVEYGTP
jgi:hypothetical protein